METALSIQSLYQSLQSDLSLLDEERIKTKEAIRKLNSIWIPILIVGGIAGLWLGGRFESIFIPFFGFAVLYVVYAMQKAKIKKAFTLSFKEKVIEKIVKKIDPGFTYKPDSIRYTTSQDHPFVHHLNSINLLPYYSYCDVEDVVEGTVKENKFEFSEIRLRTSGKNSRTVFQGILIRVLLNKSLPSHIHILPDSANKFRDGLWKTLNLKTKRGEVVELNHEAFEKLYKVYAEDPALPPALLRNHVLDNLVAIHEKIAIINPVKDSIRLAFVDNTVTIAIALNTNLFEPRLDKPINDLSYLENNAQYLTLFLGLIRDLELSR